MATTEQRSGVAENGAGTRASPSRTRRRERSIATVPGAVRRRGQGDGRARREAQPAWEALGFEERGKVLLRMQKWIVDNADRIIRAIVSETGKTYEDALLAEVMYCANAFGFWAKRRPSTSPTRTSSRATRSSRARSSSCATRRSASSA